jgi:hypothetical protein
MELQISNKKFTCYVQTDKNKIIIDAAPIIKRFIGQSLDNLTNWSWQKWGPTDIHEFK